MRRALTIFLILNLWLGPLAAILPASDESRLPPCCRRHGAHHCAMAARMAALMDMATSGKPISHRSQNLPIVPRLHSIAPIGDSRAGRIAG